jgi:hypothetical protein
MAATIRSWRLRLYPAELITRTGRSFRPVSSEKTKGTRRTSPRLKPIVRGVAAVVPESAENRIGARRHGRRIRVREIGMNAPLDGIRNVLADSQISARSCLLETAHDVTTNDNL